MLRIQKICLLWITDFEIAQLDITRSLVHVDLSVSRLYLVQDNVNGFIKVFRFQRFTTAQIRMVLINGNIHFLFSV